ncbi:DUF5431 family protein [Salmonella enterica]|nr:DUF5431 family protein [Salmonella enterica]
MRAGGWANKHPAYASESLLLHFAQGEEDNETTTKLPCLVCVDSVSHAVATAEVRVPHRFVTSLCLVCQRQ